MILKFSHFLLAGPSIVATVHPFFEGYISYRVDQAVVVPCMSREWKNFFAHNFHPLRSLLVHDSPVSVNMDDGLEDQNLCRIMHRVHAASQLSGELPKIIHSCARFDTCTSTSMSQSFYQTINVLVLFASGYAFMACLCLLLSCWHDVII